MAGDSKFGRISDADRRANDIARTLAGLTVEEARSIVSRHPDLSLRMLPGDRHVAVTGDHRVGRINAFERQGRIVNAFAG